MSRSMAKILITSGIFPPDIGGPAAYVPLIAAELLSRGHVLQIFATAEPDNLNAPLPNSELTVRKANRRTWLPLRSLNYIRQIVPLARAVDVIYANGLFFESAIAARLCGKPWVAKVVGDPSWERARVRGWVTSSVDEYQTQKLGPIQSILRWNMRSAIRTAHKVVVPSQYLADMVRGWGVEEGRVEVVYNSVALPEMRVTTATLSRPLPTSKCVVTVARLVPWKGIEEVISAINKLPDTGLLIIGDGPERQRLETHARGTLGPRCIFTGSLTRTGVWEAMSACDAFVLYSKYEGLPHIVLEAAALGLPIVTSDCRGCLEAIEGLANARSAALGDSAQLQAALLAALAAPRAINSGEWMHRFSKERMVERTENVITEIVRSRGEAHELKSQLSAVRPGRL